MKRFAPELLLSIAMVGGAVSAAAAEHNLATLPSGSYTNSMGRFQSQDSVELGLHKDGRATYVTFSKENSRPSSGRQRELIFGRWDENAGVVTVQFDEKGKTLSVAYRIVACLPYEYNTEVRCSPGIEPTDATTPHLLAQPFWSVVTVGNHFGR
jgi:hypothetical protein